MFPKIADIMSNTKKQAETDKHPTSPSPQKRDPSLFLSTQPRNTREAPRTCGLENPNKNEAIRKYIIKKMEKNGADPSLKWDDRVEMNGKSLGHPQKDPGRRYVDLPIDSSSSPHRTQQSDELTSSLTRMATTQRKLRRKKEDALNSPSSSNLRSKTHLAPFVNEPSSSSTCRHQRPVYSENIRSVSSGESLGASKALSNDKSIPLIDYAYQPSKSSVRRKTSFSRTHQPIPPFEKSLSTSLKSLHQIPVLSFNDNVYSASSQSILDPTKSLLSDECKSPTDEAKRQDEINKATLFSWKKHSLRIKKIFTFKIKDSSTNKAKESEEEWPKVPALSKKDSSTNKAKESVEEWPKEPVLSKKDRTPTAGSIYQEDGVKVLSIKRDGLCFYRAVMCATTNNKWYSTCQQKEVIDDFFLKFRREYDNAINETVKILNDIFSEESKEFIYCMSVALYIMKKDLGSTYFSESLSLHLKRFYPNESVAALRSGLNLLSDMLFNHLREEFLYISFKLAGEHYDLYLQNPQRYGRCALAPRK